MSQPAEIPAVDGRRARRERGRTAVIDAVFALLQETGAPVTVDAVCERAGVSASSVFRYFDSVDDLQRQTVERYFERYAPLFEVPALGEGTLEERIAAFVEARLDLYDAIGPIARMARSRALEHPTLRRTLDETRAMLAGQVREHFHAELGRRTPARSDDLVALVDTLTSFESWDLLRLTHGHSRRQIRRAWLTGLRAVLADGTAADPRR